MRICRRPHLHLRALPRSFVSASMPLGNILLIPIYAILPRVLNVHVPLSSVFDKNTLYFIFVARYLCFSYDFEAKSGFLFEFHYFCTDNSL